MQLLMIVDKDILITQDTTSLNLKIWWRKHLIPQTTLGTHASCKINVNHLIYILLNFGNSNPWWIFTHFYKNHFLWDLSTAKKQSKLPKNIVSKYHLTNTTSLYQDMHHKSSYFSRIIVVNLDLVIFIWYYIK